MTIETIKEKKTKIEVNYREKVFIIVALDDYLNEISAFCNCENSDDWKENAKIISDLIIRLRTETHYED